METTSSNNLQLVADTTEKFYLCTPDKELGQFNDARQAGAAYYSADEKLRPYVIHELPDGSARTMASTSIHGQRENGTNKFVKSFPGGSHSADAEFIAGFSEAESQEAPEPATAKLIAKALRKSPVVRLSDSPDGSDWKYPIEKQSRIF